MKAQTIAVAAMAQVAGPHRYPPCGAGVRA